MQIRHSRASLKSFSASKIEPRFRESFEFKVKSGNNLLRSKHNFYVPNNNSIRVVLTSAPGALVKKAKNRIFLLKTTTF